RACGCRQNPCRPDPLIKPSGENAVGLCPRGVFLCAGLLWQRKSCGDQAAAVSRGKGRCKSAMSAQATSNAAGAPKPDDKLPSCSLNHPAATGPMVWPIANRLVTTANALPQAGRGRFAFTKLVAAAGTIRALAPTSAEDSHTPIMDGANMGRAAPPPK